MRCAFDHHHHWGLESPTHPLVRPGRTLILPLYCCLCATLLIPAPHNLVLPWPNNQMGPRFSEAPQIGPKIEKGVTDVGPNEGD